VSYGSDTYQAVLIGTQTWMAKNLNYTYHYGSNVVEGKCYGNSDINCANFGRLYDWATAMGEVFNDRFFGLSLPRRGICPYGWHIPSRAEWTQLKNYLGSNAARYLKTTSGWTSCSPSSSTYVCEDAYGFSALPAGRGNTDSTFSDINTSGYWWTPEESGDTYAYQSSMQNNSNSLNSGGPLKGNFQSVRCVKD